MSRRGEMWAIAAKSVSEQLRDAQASVLVLEALLAQIRKQQEACRVETIPS